VSSVPLRANDGAGSFCTPFDNSEDIGSGCDVVVDASVDDSCGCCDGGAGVTDAKGGEARLFGELVTVADFSFCNGNTGAGGADCCVVTGDVVLAGPAAEPTLEILACRCGVVATGGGKGPRPNNEAGFVAAATADAYFSSVGGRVVVVDGLGTPFGCGSGGAAAVDVTIGRVCATLARRLFAGVSFAFTAGSSFCGVGG